MPAAPRNSKHLRNGLTSLTRQASGPKKAGTDYVALIKEAIVALKERGGSSTMAIRKHLKTSAASKVVGWEKRLSMAIKSMVKSGKLVKVRRGGASLTHAHVDAVAIRLGLTPSSISLPSPQVKNSYKLGDKLKSTPKKAKTPAVKKAATGEKKGELHCLSSCRALHSSHACISL